MLVTPKRSDNNNNSHLSGSHCNAVTAWVEVSNTLQDNWAHFLRWRGLNIVYFLWFVIKIFIIVIIIIIIIILFYYYYCYYCYYIFFAFFWEALNQSVVITGPSINQSKHKSYDKILSTLLL